MHTTALLFVVVTRCTERARSLLNCRGSHPLLPTYLLPRRVCTHTASTLMHACAPVHRVCI